MASIEDSSYSWSQIRSSCLGHIQKWLSLPCSSQVLDEGTLSEKQLTFPILLSKPEHRFA